ncbi:hypothetical protein V8G54_034749 [Vigna mungo]|uniref:Uncharacterized protein n=1 Tax=Vigna mungo TaxID=3915 RepID=A0AAQ3MDP4_VIGMU
MLKLQTESSLYTEEKKVKTGIIGWQQIWYISSLISRSNSSYRVSSCILTPLSPNTCTRASSIYKTSYATISEKLGPRLFFSTSLTILKGTGATRSCNEDKVDEYSVGSTFCAATNCPAFT